jgi:hypothetical protein
MRCLHSLCLEGTGVGPAIRMMRRTAASYPTLDYVSPSRPARSGADPATRVRHPARGGLRSDTRSHQIGCDTLKPSETCSTSSRAKGPEQSRVRSVGELSGYVPHPRKRIFVQPKRL